MGIVQICKHFLRLGLSFNSPTYSTLLMAYVKFVTILGMCESEGPCNVLRSLQLLVNTGTDEAIAGRCYCNPLCQVSGISDDMICTLYMMDGR